jgi:predicted PurR-regulated permease PerM
MSSEPIRADSGSDDKLIERVIRLGLLALLIYWSFLIVRPFVPILIWSIVLTVALYPVHAWLTRRLGLSGTLSAFLITAVSLVIIVGPVAWAGLGLIEGTRRLAELLASGDLTIPQPPESIKSWPLAGDSIYAFWELASSNLQSAFRTVAPYLKPMAGPVLGAASSAGAGVLTFLASIVVAGFLFVPGPYLVTETKALLVRVVPERSEEFVALAGATIRTVSRGVLGVAALQAVLAGIGFKVAGIPFRDALTFLVLLFSVMQLGATIIIVPAVIWSWATMDSTTALLFTAYMIPVNLVDNILKPIVMRHGVTTPMSVIFIGVIGGTLASGLIGLFIGPIVLAVGWELLRAWIRDDDATSA